MKNSAGSLGRLLLLLVIIGGCSTDKGVSDSEAVGLIVESEGIPKIDTKYKCLRGTGKAVGSDGWIIARDSMYAEIKRIIEEGYVELESNAFQTKTFKVTEKGEGVFRGALQSRDTVRAIGESRGPEEGFKHFCIFTHTRTGVDLKELRVNSESGTAEAKYAVLLEPTEYSKKLQLLDPSGMKELLEQPDPKIKTARFKRWDDGWKISK